MSTRGCVAVKQQQGFKGVYNHYDSYPEGLGKDIWDYLQNEMKTTPLAKITKQLLKYDDWRNFLNGGICEYCGKVGKGHPHSISGEICIEPYTNEQVKQNVKDTEFPDPKSKYHSHGKLADKITEKDVPDNWLEWIYVIDVKNRSLELYNTYSNEDGEALKKIMVKGNIENFKPASKKLNLVAVVNLDKPEPKWDKIES